MDLKGSNFQLQLFIVDILPLKLKPNLLLKSANTANLCRNTHKNSEDESEISNSSSRSDFYDNQKAYIYIYLFNFQKNKNFREETGKINRNPISSQRRCEWVESNNNIYIIALQKAKVKKNFQNLFSRLKFPEINNVFQSIVFVSDSLKHLFIVFNNIINLFNLLFQNNHISVAINYCFKFGLVYS